MKTKTSFIVGAVTLAVACISAQAQVPITGTIDLTGGLTIDSAVPGATVFETFYGPSGTGGPVVQAGGGLPSGSMGGCRGTPLRVFQNRLILELTMRLLNLPPPCRRLIYGRSRRAGKPTASKSIRSLLIRSSFLGEPPLSTSVERAQPILQAVARLITHHGSVVHYWHDCQCQRFDPNPWEFVYRSS